MLEKYLCKIKRFYFIISGVILLLSINLITSSLPYSESINNSEELKNLNPFLAFLLLVLIGPLLETLIFQHLPIIILPKIIKNIQEKYLIFISAILFGLSHSYNITYIIFTFLGGIILAYYYFLSIKRKEQAFLNIFLIHLILNFIPYSRDFILVNYF